MSNDSEVYRELARIWHELVAIRLRIGSKEDLVRNYAKADELRKLAENMDELTTEIGKTIGKGDER